MFSIFNNETFTDGELKFKSRKLKMKRNKINKPDILDIYGDYSTENKFVESKLPHYCAVPFPCYVTHACTECFVLT